MEQHVTYKIDVFLENVCQLSTLKKPVLFGET